MTPGPLAGADQGDDAQEAPAGAGGLEAQGCPRFLSPVASVFGGFAVSGVP